MKSINPKNIQWFIFFLLAGGVILLALAGYLKPVIGIASDPFISFQRYVATRTQAIIEFFTVPRDMASLRAQNSSLEDEVAQLQSQVIALQQQLSEADVLYALLDFAREQPENQYIASSVIGRDPSPFMHYVIIDHGSDDGIRHGMPVVTQQGLVGRIDAVTSKAARVQLITDPGSLVNVKLESSKVTAQMVGSITGEITLELIPQDLELNPGEIVLTSGLGGAYPADILIGQIVDVNVTDTALFQTATIQAVVDISNLNAVLVITNFRPVETEPLIPTAIP
jgi:rod shape-determining protein MreC